MMKKTVACTAPYGSGGLGQHFAQIVEEARAAETLQEYYTPRPQANDSMGRRVKIPLDRFLSRYTPLRFNPGWLYYTQFELFDQAVAAVLRPGDQFETACAGQASHTFRRARQLGYTSLVLQASNSHINNVKRQHQKAIERFGIESSWLNDAMRQRTLREYEMADIIHVASDYSWRSFVEAGVPVEKLRKRHFRVHPRFAPPLKRPEDGIFRIVYAGSLTVMKGIPILLEAFSRLPGKNFELTLVGGSSTRGMRRYLQAWQARNSRIRIAPGDPLPHLLRANVYVHPSYEDGFAYAPMEALACGVPVIVTEDTGMKTFVQEGVNGYVVPTGDWEAVLERLLVCQSLPLMVGAK